MEVIAHVCSALYGDGYAILKLDANNGFQEVKRASMHRAMYQRYPSLLQKYYTQQSMLLREWISTYKCDISKAELHIRIQHHHSWDFSELGATGIASPPR